MISIAVPGDEIEELSLDGPSCPQGLLPFANRNDCAAGATIAVWRTISDQGVMGSLATLLCSARSPGNADGMEMATYLVDGTAEQTNSAGSRNIGQAGG